MPVKVEELKKYEGYAEDEVEIARFLEKNKGDGFNLEEIREGIGRIDLPITPNEKGSVLTLRNAGSFSLNVADRILLIWTLNEMLEKGKISVSKYLGEKFYFIE